MWPVSVPRSFLGYRSMWIDPILFLHSSADGHLDCFICLFVVFSFMVNRLLISST